MDKYLTIENHRIPLLGFGTWNMTGKDCTAGVADAIRKGYQHIDTAQMYGNEKEVGQGVKDSGADRKELFITTKISAQNLEPEAIRQSTDESLKKLDMDFVDLLLIHWPTSSMDLDACLQTMFDLKKEGKVKHVGVSNFSPSLFRESIEKGPVICNQVEFTPYSPQMKNLEVAKEHNLMITAYSPLVKGRIKSDRELKSIGEKYNKTPAQVSLRWLLQLGNVSVIPKASSEKHRRENMEIFDFELSDEDMDRISKLKS